MEDHHPLKALLQLQLASDSYAVLHLPYVLETLTPEYFLPSSHTQKWTARVNSLLHSKDAGARWSGLCIASQTAVCSRALMMECAQSWVGVALPLLSKNEPLPTVKAAVRLLRHVFSTATNVPEFQRQVCTPNVPKFSLALIAMAEKQTDVELKLLVLSTLAYLIPLYPTLHRSLHPSLSALALRFLNGSAPKPTSEPLLAAASQLYTVLHVTGGKVGAANMWRRSFDETLGFAWAAFLNLRSTSPVSGSAPASVSGPSREDPIVSVPLNLDRLRAAVHILRDLLHAPTSRPVVIPIGSIIKLCLALLRCTPNEKLQGHVDLTARSLELAVIPAIWTSACTLLEGLAKSCRVHLRPHLLQFTSYISYHLERPLTPAQRLPFLTVVTALLTSCSHIHDSVLASRLARAILPSLTVVLATQSQIEHDAEQSVGRDKRKKGKKRARGYEGDEVFKVAREVICPSTEEGEVLLAATDALTLVMQNTPLAPAVYSVASRILLSIQIALPQMSPSLLSPDGALHQALSDKIRVACLELASGTSSEMSKSMGLVMNTIELGFNGAYDQKTHQELDLLLHPRMPPLVRSLPHVEALSLFRAEEGEEERDARTTLALRTPDDISPVVSTEALESLPPALPALHASSESPSELASRAILPLSGVLSSRVSQGRRTPPAQTTSTTSFTSNLNVARSPSNQPQNVVIGPPPIAPLTSPHPHDGASLNAKTPTSMSLTTAIPSDILPVSSEVFMEQDDEDEPMPTIDLGSDSD
ncbi:rRNA processing/ribosome biogenesis-domain-containing protein [Amylocystis lapponica]|nr:rRNA processing/ribosome biogenesis-domain-containing protein [Amylocystis lapponica]